MPIGSSQEHGHALAGDRGLQLKIRWGDLFLAIAPTDHEDRRHDAGNGAGAEQGVERDLHPMHGHVRQ